MIPEEEYNVQKPLFKRLIQTYIYIGLLSMRVFITFSDCSSLTFIIVLRSVFAFTFVLRSLPTKI